MSNNLQSDQAGPENKFKAFLKALPDVIFKLTPAAATSLAGSLAVDFQSNSAGANLLNQREQAETQLRASMFSDLISPLMGVRNNRELKLEEERLLVEMLTLNFHEHVEVKPLLLYVDNKLYKILEGEIEKGDLAEAEILDMRWSLRSIVRRVLDRQLAVLQKECGNVEHDLCTVDFNQNKNLCISLEEAVSNVPIDNNPQCLRFTETQIGMWETEEDEGEKKPQSHKVIAPDGSYNIEIYITGAEWEEWRFDVNVLIFEGDNPLPIETSGFNITPFDLPFTDNSILDIDHRFALFIHDVYDANKDDSNDDDQERFVELSVVWFPPGYILPHERPFNYREIRTILNLNAVLYQALLIMPFSRTMIGPLSPQSIADDPALQG
ncbi:MAG: hypothetical protein P8Z31_04265 [Gammaproteobacteria bacterium]